MSLPNAPQAEVSGDHTLKAKRTNAAADVSSHEREIDDRVYRLYGLSIDEIQIVKDSAEK
jgi:adenine-specific DNA-methyltransferase